ncbi:MAG: tRNA 4-thiouridine(8) synthase ThiI [Proteobacteria bacterium]|nr:tRNA 4-thiouridine(8) synthase ThiI [Pseudomonadota bacterium]
MAKGYGIFSGGLDSILAAALLQEQGRELVLLTFSTPFFGPERALVSARALGLRARVVDLTAPHMEMLQQPRHGYGRFMNPCIDCHALMFRRAGEIMAAEGGDFLFSGEVLGQRPKSQNRRALDIVAHESGYADFILRPLSARVLPPTRTEELGLVDRDRLQGFSGRTRKPQMELAARYGIKDYPSPAGGCLLTDPIFSRRLKELAGQGPLLDPRDVELLKWGRHFRLPDGLKAIVGRKKAENEALEGLFRPGDVMFKVASAPGPTVLIPAGEPEDPGLAASMTVSYSDAPDGEPAAVRVIGALGERTVAARGLPKKDFAHFMI